MWDEDFVPDNLPVKDELKYAFREKRCLVFAAATKIDMAKWEAEGVADEGHAEDARPRAPARQRRCRGCLPQSASPT